MTDGDYDSILTTALVDQYRSFWPKQVKRRCDEFNKRFSIQMYNGMKEFKREMYSILEAVDLACGCDTERQAIHAAVQPMIVEKYDIFYACAMALQSSTPPGPRPLGVVGSQEASQPVEPIVNKSLGGPDETRAEASSIHVRLSPPPDSTHIRPDPQGRLLDGTSSPTLSSGKACENSEREQNQPRSRAEVPAMTDVCGILDKSEVERRGWIFPFAKLGDGYFVLRCGTAEDPVFFNRDPWCYNRIQKHFSASHPCHDVEKTRHFSIDEIMRHFGYRLNGVDGAFVGENNRHLLQVPINNRKRKERPEWEPAHRPQAPLR